MARMTRGASIVATRRRRPPHRGQASTSMSKAWRIRWAHAQRREVAPGRAVSGTSEGEGSRRAWGSERGPVEVIQRASGSWPRRHTRAPARRPKAIRPCTEALLITARASDSSAHGSRPVRSSSPSSPRRWSSRRTRKRMVARSRTTSSSVGGAAGWKWALPVAESLNAVGPGGGRSPRAPGRRHRALRGRGDGPRREGSVADRAG